MKKNPYPFIPSLCLCGCNEITWNGRRYIDRHSSRGKCNPMYGKPSPMKGIPKTLEHNRKNSEAHKGKPRDEKTKQIIIDNIKKFWGWNKGLGEFLTPEKRQKVINSSIGRKDSEETRKNKSISHIGCKNIMWNGGISQERYCHKFNRKLKEKVRERDNFQCQFPGCLCNQLESLSIYGDSLHVHHIHYDKSNCYPDLITLCLKHNSKVNFNRLYYEKLFMNIINERNLLFWTNRRN